MKIKLKQIICFALMIATLLSVTAIPSPLAAAADVWNGSIATGFAEGNGSEDDPYLIETGAELAYLAQQVNAADEHYQNAYYVLIDDIDLGGKSWTPIGKAISDTEHAAFNGFFEGSDCTVSNMLVNTNKYFKGLFGLCGSDAVVSNLEVKGAIDNGTAGSGFGGLLIGENSGLVMNCSANGVIKGSGANACGGLIGSNTGGDGGGEVWYCFSDVKNDADSSWNGGFIGVCGGQVTSCYALGSITKGSVIGGFAGCLTDGAISNTYTAVSVPSSYIATAIQTGNSSGHFIGEAKFHDSGTVARSYCVSDSAIPADPKNLNITVTAVSLSTLKSKAFADKLNSEQFDAMQKPEESFNIWGHVPTVQDGMPYLLYAAGLDVPSFDDISNHWAEADIEILNLLGLMTGVDYRIFAPEVTLSRAMAVTILWRLEGETKPGAIAGFTDLKQDWYKDAVAWASEAKIVDGYDSTHFGPDDNITREQLAAILYRYTNQLDIDMQETGDLSEFTDKNSVSSWAVDAMKWANEIELIQGRTPTQLAPDGTATRAEAATVFSRYIVYILSQMLNV